MCWMSRLCPKPGTRFGVLNGRLALFHSRRHHTDYWAEYWTPQKCAALVEVGRSGELGELEPLIERHVPRGLPVLEAGCGPGHLVAALTARGYLAAGIDYEPRVVEAARTALPDLDLRCGDVRDLSSIPSGSIGCYLSVGVIEHFLDGPGPALSEARRVLHPDGIALVSVPYLNPARQRLLKRLKRRHEKSKEAGPDKDPDVALHFHQFYFTRDELRAALANAGFEWMDDYPYGVEATITREHPLIARFWESALARERLKRRLRSRYRRASMRLRRRWGHMLMAVCRCAPVPPAAVAADLPRDGINECAES